MVWRLLLLNVGDVKGNCDNTRIWLIISSVYMSMVYIFYSQTVGWVSKFLAYSYYLINVFSDDIFVSR